MRELLAFLTLIILVTIGWNQSYLEHYWQLTGASPRAGSSRMQGGGNGGTPRAGKSGKGNGSWMWEKTSLDRADNQ
jgi:hypothetical protein